MKKKSIYMADTAIAKIESVGGSASFNKSIEAMAMLGFHVREKGLETIRAAKFSRYQVSDVLSALNGVEIPLKFAIEMLTSNLEDFYKYNQTETSDEEQKGLMETINFWEIEDPLAPIVLVSEVSLFWQGGKDLDAFLQTIGAE